MKRFIFLLAAIALACSGPTVPTLVAVSTETPSPTATSLVAAPKISATRTPPAATRLATVIASRSLHVRAEPGERAVVVGYLYTGDPVELTGECSEDPAGWAQIEWDDGTAWVRAKFLSDNECQSK
jgi:hypothetical protein